MNKLSGNSVLHKLFHVSLHSPRHMNTSGVHQQILKEVPTVRGLPMVGTLFSLLSVGGAEQLHKYIDRRHKEVGPIFRENIGPMSSVFVSDAGMIDEIFANEGKYPKHVLPESWIVYNEMNDRRRGLFFMNDEEWHSHRKLLNRILLKDDFKKESEKFEKSGFLEAHLESWFNNDGDETSVFNLEEKLYNLSTTFMVYYLMGTDFFENEPVFASRVQELALIVRRIFQSSVKLSTIPTNLARRLNLKPWSEYVQAVNESVRHSTELLTEMYKYEKAGDGILRAMLDSNLSKEAISRIVIDFMIAAGDTTATAAQWLFYLLAKNKDVQGTLCEQIQRDCGDTLLKNIIKESMRLYPVAPFITRYMPRDVIISSYKLRSGDLVSMSMYTCGRSERYFPDAERFYPDRWRRINSKLSAVNNINASLPYAKGGRSCIGRKLSNAQLSAVIKKTITSYELNVDNIVDIKLNLISVPSEPIRLRMKKRMKNV